MKIVKVIILVVITLSALTAIACLGLLSAEDYMIREQAAYEEPVESQIYDPEIFAYNGIKLADLKKDEKGHYIMTDQQRETFIKNILGKHMCSLQWISWKDFGSVSISYGADNILYVKGGQTSKTNGDFLEMYGTLTVINPLHLQFNGQIITCVEHINDGKPVKREGTYNFTVAGQRRYWRMQEMNNPKDGYCDYVDIYFD